MTSIEPDVSKWDAWRPEQVARLLDGVRVPWHAAAGSAAVHPPHPWLANLT